MRRLPNVDVRVFEIVFSHRLWQNRSVGRRIIGLFILGIGRFRGLIIDTMQTHKLELCLEFLLALGMILVLNIRDVVGSVLIDLPAVFSHPCYYVCGKATF